MAIERTSEEAIEQIASLLGKFVPGEALGSVEHDTISGCIDDVLEEISGIVFIADRDAIPGKYFQTVCRLITVHAASKFSNVPLDLDAVKQHEDRLRYLSAGDATTETVKAKYF